MLSSRLYRPTYFPVSVVSSRLCTSFLVAADQSDSGDLDEVGALREIWEKQGVGKDGYLSLSELGAICENMGMEKMSDKVFFSLLHIY